jgi:hypothetical protein
VWRQRLVPEQNLQYGNRSDGSFWGPTQISPHGSKNGWATPELFAETTHPEHAEYATPRLNYPTSDQSSWWASPSADSITSYFGQPNGASTAGSGSYASKPITLEELAALTGRSSLAQPSQPRAEPGTELPPSLAALSGAVKAQRAKAAAEKKAEEAKRRPKQ